MIVLLVKIEIISPLDDFADLYLSLRRPCERRISNWNWDTKGMSLCKAADMQWNLCAATASHSNCSLDLAKLLNAEDATSKDTDKNGVERNKHHSERRLRLLISSIKNDQYGRVHGDRNQVINLAVLQHGFRKGGQCISAEELLDTCRCAVSCLRRSVGFPEFVSDSRKYGCVVDEAGNG